MLFAFGAGAWYWENAPKKLKHHWDCCSRDAMVFHNYRGSYVNKQGAMSPSASSLRRMEKVYDVAANTASRDIDRKAKGGSFRSADHKTELRYLKEMVALRERFEREGNAGALKVGMCDDADFDVGRFYNVPSWWVERDGHWESSVALSDAALK